MIFKSKQVRSLRKNAKKRLRFLLSFLCLRKIIKMKKNFIALFDFDLCDRKPNILYHQKTIFIRYGTYKGSLNFNNKGYPRNSRS